ncbi:MAG: amidohydrolase family protein, partial [Candidatus Cloacimonetes bacterium]|nr:amidohydrolase family protein [Candidatus Cloacimonadota bacterium]
LDDTELNLIKKSRSSIVHCPDSNFFLKSGTFNLNKILEYQIPFGLGSDIGAGTNLYMPYHARMMIYRQDNFQINPLNAFYSFTLGSAEALKKSNQIGSIQPLKFADMTFVKQDITYTNPEEIVSKLIFTTNPTDVKKVIVNGKTIHEKD